ncbi:MAG: hypothetical protein SCK70_13375, partial [bacterium]|nr:hypothetical protein [bacterium]
MKAKPIISLMILFVLSLSANLIGEEDYLSIKERHRVRADDNLIVLIDVDAGNITLASGSIKNEAVISGKINERFDRVNIGYDERQNELSISLDRRNWVKSMSRDGASYLNIQLPENVVIELRSKVKGGVLDFSVGRLKIASFEMKNFAGEVFIDFDKPNPVKMDFLDIDVKIGRTELRNLGNARFVEANINGGIGELSIDLSGANVQQSRVDIDLYIGSTEIT